MKISKIFEQLKRDDMTITIERTVEYLEYPKILKKKILLKKGRPIKVCCKGTQKNKKTNKLV